MKAPKIRKGKVVFLFMLLLFFFLKLFIMLNNIVLATTNVCVGEGEKVSHLLYEWKLVEYLFIIVTKKKATSKEGEKCISVYVHGNTHRT